HSVAEKPARSWRFGIEDILTALPWGETTLQSVAQQVRSAENRLLVAEKMAAMAWLAGHGIWPVSELRAAWDELMWAQHHDAWIVSSGREGRQAWAFQAAAQTLNAEGSASQIVADSAEFLSRGQHGAVRQSPGTQWFRVFNSLAVKRDEVTELPLDTDRGTQGVRVFDASGREVVCQAVPTRRYRSREAPDAKETVNSALVLFRAQIPALGFATYRVEPVYDAQPASSQEPVRAALESDGNVTLENELYRLVLDPRRGGAITSLYAKTLKKEFCDASAERLFNEYRGYFISQERWRSSTETAAEVKLLESGPVRARVQFAGNVGGVPCQTIISLAEGQRRIEFQVSFRYEQETWIGDPFDLKPMLPGIGWSENRRSPFDGRSKLQALFPVSLRNHAVYKNAAYDVCRSRHANTYFQRWDEIKHNIIVNWVDLVDERENYGLAVLSDHTTGYTHGPDHPLALVLGWGWSGGCVQRKCPLKGPRQMKYAVVPHTGIWNEARLSEENARWVEPPITQLMDGGPPDGSGTRSFLAISGTGIEVPTMLSDGSRLLVRLFNAEGDETERIISLDARLRRAELVELDGRSVRQLPMRTASDGRREIRLAIPRFGLRTLRCELEFNKT
ncbi:MAG: glycoside hydrolase family 38 C-terminal domain-containing protein, partial [Blastocatellia bacterium]